MHSPSQTAILLTSVRWLTVRGVVNICRVGLAPEAARLNTGTYITSIVTTAIGTCLTASLVTRVGLSQLHCKSSFVSINTVNSNILT